MPFMILLQNTGINGLAKKKLAGCLPRKKGPGFYSFYSLAETLSNSLYFPYYY